MIYEAEVVRLAVAVRVQAWERVRTRRVRGAAWENEGMFTASDMLEKSQGKAAAIAVLILLLAALTWMIPPRAIETHNVLHHMNILPFLMAGLIFGWRGAMQAVLFAAVVQTPSIVRHWVSWPLDAQDQIVELTVFGLAGAIAGLLSDREREQRRRVETTTRELEEVYVELREKIDQMKKAERLSAAGQLSASLAHEIRNPLASISGAAGILMRGQASAENRDECLSILAKESQRLNKLLTNFLDFARPRLPRFQTVDASSIVDSTAALAQHAAVLHEVELVTEFAPGLPEIACDAEQIKQVLLNLIINAAQATEGRGEVRIHCFSERDRLCITVTDGGGGISAEDQERIFDPFFTTKESGTGLGLAVAANIVAQHGGELRCASNADRGMTFRVELPIERAQARQMRGAPEESHVRARATR